MSIGKSNFKSANDSASNPELSRPMNAVRSLKGFARRVREHRRRKDRRSLIESLEQRHLMAGPNLVGIQPNQSELLADGSLLNTAPRELVFRFDDATSIDPATLDGIRITRRGDDNSFESATALSDVGTRGAALVEFTAVPEGTAGEGITVRFTTSSRPVGAGPLVTVLDKAITVNINSNPQTTPTQVRTLISAIENSAAARALVRVVSFTGSTSTAIDSAAISGTTVTLRGANVADAVSDVGTNNAVRVRFLSAASGPEGRNTRVVLERADFGGPANPLVLVSGNTVTVRINSNPGNETTVASLLNAINTNSEASQIITAVLEVGSATTLLGNRTNFATTLTLTGADDVVVQPGFVGLGNSPNEVIFRFAESLPQDTYQIDIFGSGSLALTNLAGEAFNSGVNISRRFTLNLGPKVLAVVPEPIRRTSTGLSPAVGVIEVHFNGDTLDQASAQDPRFYQLIYSADTVSSLDDRIVYPTLNGLITGASRVSYNSSTNIATLTFPAPLARMPNGSGGFLAGAARLRVGNNQTLPPAPVSVPVVGDPSDSFATARPLGQLQSLDSSGTFAIRLESEVRNTTSFDLNLPGADAPGVQNIRPDDPSRLLRTIPLDYFRQGADGVNGISTIAYDFATTFQGDDPNTPQFDTNKTYFNLISDLQKERVREVLSLFSQYLGVQFVERTSTTATGAFFSITVGDLAGVVDNYNPATTNLSVATADRNLDGINDLVVMDFADFEQSIDDQFGGEFFRGAMLAVGQLLGYGYADGLPQPVSQSTNFVFSPGTENEPYYPSVSDIVNGQYLYRPDSTDVDLYSFTLSRKSKISIQTFAERLLNASLLDTQVRLYQRDGDSFVEVAQNDDYFSNDSLIEVDLAPGTYFVGVSASGNDKYDPSITNTGFGGLSQGAYELRITAVNDLVGGTIAGSITDLGSVPLDGDADGTPGGLFDFWFVPANPGSVLYVDKAVKPTGTPTGTGSISSPFSSIASAVAAAVPGTTIRVVGNGGVDGRLETPGDAFSYQIGFDNRGIALADGSTLDVPNGVQLVIEAGAVFKMRTSRIGVGSTAPLVDRSGSSIQVLGTPSIVTSSGFVARNSLNEIIPGSVYFTSYNDTTLGNGNFTASVPAPVPGDWGGIDIRADLDNGDSSRRNRENEGVFLNHIQFADFRFGGGQVRVDGRPVVVSSVELALTRATIINSRITRSADAAIAATPDTFRETRFDEPFFQQNGVFTPSVSRVGPEIHGNTIVDNSINGLFVRISTRTGEALQPLTTAARFDDTDIVHVLAENLVVKGTPGGPIAPAIAPSSLAVSAVASPTGGSVPTGTYVYSISFASQSTESLASGNTIPTTLSATGRVELNQLPTVPAGSGFTSRRLYRATVAADGTIGNFVRIADLNGTDTSFIDRSAGGSIARPAQQDRFVARQDASLKVDPGTVIKMNGARIELTFGADLIAEGTSQNPVIITSIKDKRFGAGGTFDTNSDEPGVVLSRGDWAGIYVGPTSSASLDRVTLAGAGGQSRIEGGIASFNAIEVHQGDLRIANSRLENNADGRGFVDVNELDRVGRSTNASGTIFVRGSQPTIVNNVMINGLGPVITVDVNSLVWNEVNDRGRSRGELGSVTSIANSGPLVSGNRLGNNQLNGMEVRGGQVATEIAWDDVDIVHIVRDMIEIPNQHIYGGLRLQSDARGSLVVKFENTAAVAATLTTPAIAGRIAGIVAGGTLTSAAAEFVGISDRIGGSLQIVGQPDFPVVLTALVDDTIGAGFSPTGQQSVDTNNDGIRRTNLTSDTDTVPPPPGLPLGPEYDRTTTEVNNGTRIDNDVDPNNIGFFEATPVNGGEVANISVSGAAGTAANPLPLVQQNFGFLNTTFVDIDYDGINGTRAPIRLSGSTITQAATLVSPDRVISTGLIDLVSTGDQLLAWTAETFFVNNRAVMYTTLNFSTVDGRPFNGTRPGFTNRATDIRVVNYLDIGIGLPADDILYTVGTAGQSDFRAYTVDGATRIGFSHGGIYTNDGTNQVNATYNGWGANVAPTLLAAIAAETTQFSQPGQIDVVAFPPNATPALAAIPSSSTGFGPGNVSTAFSWSLTLSQSRARVTTLVELLPTDPGAPFPISLPPSVDGVGSWNGITIREAANDRNVYSSAENETRLTALGESNAVPSLSQFLGELAPNSQSGDENRRLGFVVNGSILKSMDSRDEGDVDVYSFVGQAGTQVWLDIDRTDLSLDAVLELIDANGQILILSDDSLAESRGDFNRLQPSGSLFQASNARALNVIPAAAGSSASAYQDQYSINPRDPGMRVVLPGLPGERNVYHVRVRASNARGADRSSLLNPTQVLNGISTGNYQLQIRLSETDETAGTQLRYADVRYAVNGVQVIGGPLHSPLTGDDYETVSNNDTFANAQRLGLFSVAVDATAASNIGPLASDRLAKSVGGALSSATDIDWFQFDVNYQNVTRDDAALYLSTIFDIDYADGFGRADVAIYVFNAAGQLILVGSDSNVADDQATGLDGTNASDLSRGSAGTKDPFIGAAELAEGNYFVAVVNQSQIPNVLNQFNASAATNPLLRLEPIDSVTRIAEDRIGSVGGGTASSPTVRLLFDGNNSVVPYTLNDQILYTLDGANVGLANPFAGGEYGNVGANGNSFRDFAFYPNGELFAYSTPSALVNQDLDISYSYFRINSENGTATNIGLTGIETFHVALNQAGVPTVVDSNDGIRIEAMTFDTTRTVSGDFVGFFVGNRPINHAGNGVLTQNQYFQNIVYAFNPQTGAAFDPNGQPVRQIRTVGTLTFDERADGAGTQIRERGFIETGTGVGGSQVSNQLVVPNATSVNPNGTGIALINDGAAFAIQMTPVAPPFRLELDSGPVLNFVTNPTAGAFATDGLVFSITSPSGTQIYELDSGPVVVIDAALVVDGASVTVQDTAGVTLTFEFNSNGTLSNPNAISVAFSAGATSAQLAQLLATAVSNASFGTNGFATPGQGRIDFTGDSTANAPLVAGSGLSVVGAAGSADPNIPGTNVIRVRENFTGQELAQAVAAATGGAVAGNRVNFRTATATNITNLIARNIVTQTGASGVTTGSTGVRFLVSDTGEAIAIRIQQVVNSTPSISSAGITATTSQNAVIFQNANLNGSNGSVDASFALGNLPPGGLVTGVAMVGSSLYAVSSAGGLYIVSNPLATVQGRIGGYVSSASALIGLNFTGLSAGPQNIEGGRFANLLFGVTASGDLYAFDTAGRLQPVFAGGATNVNIGGGTLGIDFSTLDYNLWHTSERREDDLGHGINPIHNGTRNGGANTRITGGTSYYFGFEGATPNGISAASTFGAARARQDGQGVVGTYNFPGGAKGAIESNPVSLVGYSADDLPTLYFNYFLETDGFNSVVTDDRDAFRVYVIDNRGVEHLVTTNNVATANGAVFNDEFDDPTNSIDPAVAARYADTVDVKVQPTFDNTNSWRQARVSLADFAGQANLRLRIEFSTGASFSDQTLTQLPNGTFDFVNSGSLGLRAVAGNLLTDGQTIEISGRTFEIDLGATLSVPSGVQVANFYAQAGASPANRVTAVVGGVTYVLNDGIRTVNPGEVNVALQVSGDAPLSTFTADLVASRLATAIRTNGVPTTNVAFSFLGEPNDELLSAIALPAVTGRATVTGTGRLEAGNDVDLFRIDLPAGSTISVNMAAVAPDSFISNVRLFDLAGNQLSTNSILGPATFRATAAQTIVIGFSSNSNSDYSPIVAGSGSPGVLGNYSATIDLVPDFRVLQSGANLQITGGIGASAGADGLVVVNGAPGTNGIPIVVDASMTASQVATALQAAIARQFSRGITTAYPVSGSTITLAGLAITNSGPFGIAGLRSSDVFGTSGTARAIANNFEGVYVDDFIIGFAERGEIATGAALDTSFILDTSPTFPEPDETLGGFSSGTYQLEIRDGSEYVNSLAQSQFRTFDTNDRLSDGLTIQIAPAASIVDGATFQISDGVSTVTFEFDTDTVSRVRPGNVRVAIPTAASLPAGDDGSIAVARAVIAAINNQSVRSLIDVAAVAADGVNSRNSSTVNLFGNVLIPAVTGGISQIVSRNASGQSLRVLPAISIADGATFQVLAGSRTVTFEFDVETPAATTNGVGSINNVVNERIVVTTAMQSAADGGVRGVNLAVANAIRVAFSRLGVSANVSDGGGNRIDVVGPVSFVNFRSSLLSVSSTGTLRGDQNRDRSEQGMILIENSRFVFNSVTGIDIVHDTTSRTSGINQTNTTPSVVTYPRNLVEINSQRLVPGVVVQSNVLAFNQTAGIQVTGIVSGGETGANPVPFDRIINNTIVGGVITSGEDVVPGTFVGIDFPGGAISFADALVSFTPGTGVSAGFDDPQRALGAPSVVGRGDEPIDGLSTLSMGSGGVLVVQFTDNLLTGSDDARPDLIIFETGEIESVRVAVSRDGVSFVDVGILGGVDNTIDLDRFGFGSQDRFAFVRLTDLRQGTRVSGPVGADIDAIGALSTAPTNVYLPGSQGIVVRQNAAPTLLNNVVANTQTGIAIDSSSTLSVVGGTSYYRNAINVSNPQSTPLGSFADVIPNSLELFVDPTRLAFAPRAGVPIIDASIDSLEDRASLRVVRNSIGLPPSPIIAPRLDVNGQLRVDDPAVETPPGVGDRVFKDRGAEDRADDVGPRAVLVGPRGFDLGLSAGQASTALGSVFDSFDIQLIDGIGPADPTPGVGIDDSTVTSNTILLTRDGVPLIEGVDYRFGYDASNNIIRLTPIAGIWEDDSTYVVRLLDASDSVLRFGAGSTLTDGSITTLLTSTGTFREFEIEQGISITINPDTAIGGVDGQVITVFDGAFELSFELNNNAIAGTTTILVNIAATASPAQIASALAVAIEATALNVTAIANGAVVQLLGPSSLTTVTPLTPLDTVFGVGGAIGTRVGFGIGIPATGAAPAASVQDAQTFSIRRGANLVRQFELDFGGGIQTPNAIPVSVGLNPTLDQIADAIVRAVGGAGLGLAPVNAGQGRVVLGGDANYSLDVSGSSLVQLGAAGQRATVPVVVPIDATIDEVVAIAASAISGAGLTGVTFSIVGDRLILEGVAAVSGLGQVTSPIVRDKVGNLLQSGTTTGRTELTIFIGGGFDYGDANAPYLSTLADGGPRVRVVTGFSLGSTNSPEADAAFNNGDAGDDGVELPLAFASGFNTEITIDVRATPAQSVFYVDAWFDWDRDGIFEATELTRFRSIAAPGAGLAVLGVGVNTVNIAVPAGVSNGPSFARFRLSTVAGLGPNDTPMIAGNIGAGEIEDYSIVVQSNRFQNPLKAADVNKSGVVTPLDALNVINLLSTYRRNPATPPPGNAIDLTRPETFAFMTEIVDGRFLPDVDGNGRVEPLDALRVINELARQKRNGNGEGESFTPVGNGLLASPLTMATNLPTITGRSVVATEPMVTGSASPASTLSVFDIAGVVALDEILDDIANDERASSSEEENAIDAVFSGLGLGL